MKLFLWFSKFASYSTKPLFSSKNASSSQFIGCSHFAILFIDKGEKRWKVKENLVIIWESPFESVSIFTHQNKLQYNINTLFIKG